MLYVCCSYINVYKIIKKILFKQNHNHFKIRVVFDPQLKLVIKKNADHQRENLFVINEIAALILNIFSGWADPWDLVFAYRHPTRRNFQNVHPTHFSYMSLTYPLFFPRGDKGWHWDLQLICLFTDIGFIFVTVIRRYSITAVFFSVNSL